MCINMVNERLQYFMNNVVLIQEKKIYESEEIPFENVDFKDNMNIIQMFEISVNFFNYFWINVFEIKNRQCFSNLCLGICIEKNTPIFFFTKNIHIYLLFFFKIYLILENWHMAKFRRRIQISTRNGF